MELVKLAQHTLKHSSIPGQQRVGQAVKLPCRVVLELPVCSDLLLQSCQPLNALIGLIKRM